MVEAVILLREIRYLHPKDIFNDTADIRSLEPDAHIVNDNGQRFGLRIEPFDRVHDLVLPLVRGSNLTALQAAQVLDGDAELQGKPLLRHAIGAALPAQGASPNPAACRSRHHRRRILDELFERMLDLVPFVQFRLCNDAVFQVPQMTFTDARIIRKLFLLDAVSAAHLLDILAPCFHNEKPPCRRNEKTGKMACCRFCRCAEMLIKSKFLNGYRLLSTLLLEQEGDDAGAAAPRPPAAQACAGGLRAARRRAACVLSADVSDTKNRKRADGRNHLRV